MEELTKEQKIEIIINCLKENSNIPMSVLSEKTGLSIDTIKNHIGFVKNKYRFTIVEKNSKIEEYLDIHGWFNKNNFNENLKKVKNSIKI